LRKRRYKNKKKGKNYEKHYSSNTVANVQGQENSVQTRWQPYKLNSVTDSFSAEKSSIKAVAVAVKEIFTNFAKLIGNLGISLGNKVFAILNSSSNPAPAIDSNTDSQHDDLKTELSEAEKAQGWTRTQKAVATVAAIGTVGVAFKTLAYFGGKDSYAEMPWNYTFGFAGEVLNTNVIEPGMLQLNSLGDTVYETVCQRGLDANQNDLGDRCADTAKELKQLFCDHTGYGC
jgi:hypothetical protein